MTLPLLTLIEPVKLKVGCGQPGRSTTVGSVMLTVTGRFAGADAPDSVPVAWPPTSSLSAIAVTGRFLYVLQSVPLARNVSGPPTVSCADPDEPATCTLAVAGWKRRRTRTLPPPGPSATVTGSVST